MLCLWIALTPFGHIGLIFLPGWFFQHVLFFISMYAIIGEKRISYDQAKDAE